MRKQLMTSIRSKRFIFILCLVVILLICFLTTDHSIWCPPESKHAQVTKKRVTHSSGGCTARNMLASFRNYEDVSQFDTCTRIFYNRVPKCASRTILSTMRALSFQRNFTLVSAPRASYYTLNSATQVTNFTRQFNSVEEPFIYSKHVYFFNFTDCGMPMPIYINVIRDPLERAVSHYYYHKYGSSSKPSNSSAAFNETGQMKECVDEKKCILYFNVILPFFCGNKRSCRKYRSPDDRWLLVSRAKQVIRQRYLVVGLTEDIPAFLEVVESYMPSFFKNATNIFNDIGGKMKAKYKTVKKPTLDVKLEKKLKKRLAADYELYGFVKQRFYNQLKRVRTWKEQRSYHNLFKDVINGKPIENTGNLKT